MLIAVNGALGGIGQVVFRQLSFDGTLAGGVYSYDIQGRRFQPEFARSFDVIVNCQGRNPSGEEPDGEVWAKAMEANLISLEASAAEFVRQEVGARERRIFIAITSNSAAIPRSNSRVYCASKAAADMLMKVYHREHAWRGFEFYSLCPGPVATDATVRLHNALGPEAWRKMDERLPLRRMAEPVELAEWVKFIIKNRAAVLAAGQSLRLDSGEH